MLTSPISYSHEFPRRLRVALVGCGGQAFRNLLPSFAYAPIELIATADLIAERAAQYARQFGARRSYSSLAEVLRDDDVEAVLLAAGYGRDGRPLYPEQAVQVMEAGKHVWIEKPPAFSAVEIEGLIRVSKATSMQVAVGFMKMFAASTRKVHEIIQLPEFGRPTTLYLRDPEQLPPAEARRDPARMRWFLDHIVHPASVLHRLMGPVSRLYTEEGPDGEPIFTLKFRNGAAGALHMPWGISGNSPMERLEVVGQGANVVVDNNIRITYYRPGHRGDGQYEYGRTPDYTSGLSVAPLAWEMDAYSGQPYNLNLFYQGYAPCLIYFAQQVLSGASIEVGGLADAWHIIQIFESCSQPSNTIVEFPAFPESGELLPARSAS